MMVPSQDSKPEGSEIRGLNCLRSKLLMADQATREVSSFWNRLGNAFKYIFLSRERSGNKVKSKSKKRVHGPGPVALRKLSPLDAACFSF